MLRHPSRRGERRGSLVGSILLAIGALLLGVAAFCLSIHLQNNRYLLDATAFIFDAPGTDESKAIALMHFVAERGDRPVDEKSSSVVARIEHQLPFELSPVTVLRYGFAFPDARRFGACGQLSRTMRAAAEMRGIRTHKVLLGNGHTEHALVAFHIDGADRLFDPSFDFHWTNREGRVASIDEVRSDPAIFAQIHQKVANYDYDFRDATYFRWNRLGPGGAWVKRTLTSLMGERWVARVDTPLAYDRPWLGYTWISLIAALCFIAAATARFLMIRPRLRFQEARMPVPGFHATVLGGD